MSLWLRTRHAHACVITIVTVVFIIFFSGSTSLPIPRFFGGPTFAIPLAFLVPLAVAIVVAWGLTTGDPFLEMVASRPLPLLDAAYALCAAILTLAICALLWLIGDNELMLAAGRNAVGYVGMALVGRRIVGSDAAAILPVGFAFFVSLFGTGADRQPYWWAWPLYLPGDLLAWAIVAMLLSFGVAVVLLRTNARAGQYL